MIVTTDFLDHWKTAAIIRLTDDKTAPLALIRLWGYCQQRKTWQFPKMTPETVAQICRWDNPTVSCYDALVQCGFLDVLPGGGYEVHGWFEANRSLAAAWKNGRYGVSGGRPSRPVENENPAGSRRPPDDLSSLSNPSPSSQSPQSDSEAFDKFWAAYPNKTKQLEAKEAFNEALTKTTIEEILTAIEASKTSHDWTKECGKYIPNPANWLRDRRWTDRPIPTTGIPIDTTKF
jgi:hypothetical protein